MNLKFLAERRPEKCQIQALAELSPDNPFNAAAYAATRVAFGAEPWLLAICRDAQLISGCYGFLTQGRLTRRLEIHSLPKLEKSSGFWPGLVDFCQEQKVTELQINSFGSTETKIPSLGRELERRARREYRLNLEAPDLWRTLSSNHKRNIKRARKAGLVVVEPNDSEAAEAHAQAIGKSMQRREARGESVYLTTDARPIHSIIGLEAGQLYQATAKRQVVSSLLVLRGVNGAYYHSAGSFPEGMALGAAHFLIASVAERLKDQGLELFNLGGADATEEGLARFKAGFGALPLDLEAARFAMCSPAKGILYALGRAIGA